MIARRIEQKIFRDVAPQTIRHIAAVHQREATGFVKDVYQQMAKDFQVVPPLMLHSPVPQVLAAVYPSDAELVSTAAWASYVAARKVASWMRAPSNQPAEVPMSALLSP